MDCDSGARSSHHGTSDPGKERTGKEAKRRAEATDDVGLSGNRQ